MTIELVDFPIENGDFPLFFVSLPGRVNLQTSSDSIPIPGRFRFLADEWATALFHDRFMDFCRELRTGGMQGELLISGLAN